VASELPPAPPGEDALEHEPRPPSGLVPGDVLGERYRISRRLGVGGMGEVWQAERLDTGDALAIKALALDRRRDDGTRAERLIREAKIVARIEHPNVVAITDFGQTATGSPFIAMELLHGRALHELLRAEGALPWARVAAIGSGVARGLAAAHALGVVHRDLKPANVFVLDDRPGAACKVIDFGIAKATAVDDGDRPLTRTGLVFGTPSYMSPEQARGEPIDGRTDVYALGCILHEALTGRRLFSGRAPAEIIYRQLFETPRAPGELAPEADIPASLDAIVQRCLRKHPTNRYQHMHEVAEHLAAALRGEIVEPPPPEIVPAPPPALRARYGAPVDDAIEPPAWEMSSVRARLGPRPVLRALGLVLGGAVLGLLLVIGALVVHRMWVGREAAADARAAPAIGEHKARSTEPSPRRR